MCGGCARKDMKSCVREMCTGEQQEQQQQQQQKHSLRLEAHLLLRFELETSEQPVLGWCGARRRSPRGRSGAEPR